MLLVQWQGLPLARAIWMVGLAFRWVEQHFRSVRLYHLHEGLRLVRSSGIPFFRGSRLFGKNSLYERPLCCVFLLYRRLTGSLLVQEEVLLGAEELWLDFAELPKA